jgi:hypothetical protein
MNSRAAKMKSESAPPLAVCKDFLKTMTSDCPSLYPAFKCQMRFPPCFKNKQAAWMTPRGLVKLAMN